METTTLYYNSVFPLGIVRKYPNHSQVIMIGIILYRHFEHDLLSKSRHAATLYIHTYILK